MKDDSLHIKKDGRVFQMLDGFSNEPMPFRDAKHNYTRKDFDKLDINQCIFFNPMYGNDKPVYSILKRIK